MMIFDLQYLPLLLKKHPFPKHKDINEYYFTSCLAQALKDAGVNLEFQIIRFVEKKPINELGKTPIKRVQDVLDFKIEDGPFYNQLKQDQFKKKCDPKNTLEVTILEKQSEHDYALNYAQTHPLLSQWQSEITATIVREYLLRSLKSNSEQSSKLTPIKTRL